MSVRYTPKEAERFNMTFPERMALKGFTEVSPGVWQRKRKAKLKVKNGVRLPRKNKNLDDMKLTLKLSGIEFVSEYQFSPPRKFRADIAILSPVKLIIEYEGIFSPKSRHTNVKGYSKDSQKYNLAQVSGFKVLRYTAMNYTEMINDVRKLIEV